MTKSIVSDTRKRPQGRPRVDATPVMVRMPPAELAGVDTWIRGRPQPKPSRPEAIRRLVEIGLGSAKIARGQKRSDSPTARDLAAAQIDRLTDPAAPADEQAHRKRHLLKGPEEFREVRVDRPKVKK